MRNILALFTAGMLALVLAPAAQAHHVDLNRSTVECALENNAPVITLKVLYVDFEEYNKPVRWELRFDDVVVDNGLHTWAGPSDDHDLKKSSKPGLIEVEYHSSWGSRYSGGAATLRRVVFCPEPVPPPTLIGCDGKPIPAGGTPPVCRTVTIVCDGQEMPPGFITCPPPPSPPSCAVCPPPRVIAKCVPRRDIVFHVYRGSANRLGKVRLYVRGKLVRVKHGHYKAKSLTFRSVYLGRPGKDGRTRIRIVALLRNKDTGKALQFRVRDRVKPCGSTIRRDP
jgi:hypothetical protein